MTQLPRPLLMFIRAKLIREMSWIIVGHKTVLEPDGCEAWQRRTSGINDWKTYKMSFMITCH